MTHPAIITAYFANKQGNPATGLLPGITIREVTSTVGSPQGDVIVVGDGSPITPMIEIGGGFYKFIFTTYDSTRKYAYIIDGEAIDVGINLGLGQFVVGTNENFAEDISHQVWEEPANLHPVGSPASMGSQLNQTHAKACDILDFTELLIAAQYNRTFLDKVAATLTIFGSDGVTPIRVFSLRDSGGAPSITEIVDRFPISGSPLVP